MRRLFLLLVFLTLCACASTPSSAPSIAASKPERSLPAQCREACQSLPEVEQGADMRQWLEDLFRAVGSCFTAHEECRRQLEERGL